MTVATSESSYFHFPHAVGGAQYMMANASACQSIRQIGIVLFDGFSLSHAGFIIEAFQLANQLAASFAGQGRIEYQVRLLSFGGGVVLCSSALGVGTERLDSRQYGSSDALLTADGKIVDHADYEAVRFYKTLRSSSELSLDSVPEVIQVCTNPSGFDADKRCESLSYALALIKRDLGLKVAREIAELLFQDVSLKLLALLRDNDSSLARDKIHASARWIDANCDRSISVVDAAQMAAMSGRNYLRCFKDEMGMPPSEYLFRARMAMVCRLLIGTDLPVEKIARRSGMGDGNRLGKMFRKRMLMSPTEYRLRNNHE